MLRSHRIRLTPTASQTVSFQRHAGFARIAYNWAVSEFSAGLSVGEWCGTYTLTPRFNRIKHHLWPWHTELSQLASKGAIADAGRAIQRWGAYRKSGGRFVGFPHYKRRGARQAFRADNGPDTVRCNGRRIILPAKMGGVVRMREALRWTGRITGVRISKRASHWYASVTVDDGLPLPPVADNGKPALGVDLGIKSMGVCSDGVIYDAPKPLRRLYSKLRRASKSLSRKVKGSANWHKQVAAVQRLHSRIADLRNDAIHKATSDIVSRAGAVSVEDLNVSGMVRNRRLARAISDIGMSEFLRQLEYKCAWAGIPFRRVNRWFPSSKMCQHCGHINKTLTLAMRDWQCPDCGQWLERDANASVNIRDYRRPGAARLQPVEICVSPGEPCVSTANAVAVSETGITPVNRQLRLL